MSPKEHARTQPEGGARAKPVGTTMLDDQDMYKDLQAKDQVGHGMIKHGSSAKKMPILRIEN